MKRFLVCFVLMLVLPLSATSATSAQPVNSISVTEPVVSGSSFNADFTAKSNAYPWGYLTCSNGLEEWRANQGDGTVGVFELLNTSPGDTCTIDLVDTRKYTVLASVSFILS